MESDRVLKLDEKTIFNLLINVFISALTLINCRRISLLSIARIHSPICSNQRHRFQLLTRQHGKIIQRETHSVGESGCIVNLFLVRMIFLKQWCYVKGRNCNYNLWPVVWNSNIWKANVFEIHINQCADPILCLSQIVGMRLLGNCL